ncbi:type II toxin-antitoxin system RelB family antitoxin, partial [Corynebacterium glyciniphilum]
MSIRFTADEESRLEALATRTGRSKSFYVREAVQAHLAELEDAYGAGRSGA